MRLGIGGGVKEHGRNCFYIEGERTTILLDAGLSGDGTNPYPSISAKQLQACSYLFLSHSHKDHSGALRHFQQLGFHGIIVASKATIGQLALPSLPVYYVEDLCEEERWYQLQHGVSLCWGKSGHCEGSVWFHIRLDDRTILYTGDYREHNEPYPCTPIRHRNADLAIIDCAYGMETKKKTEYLEELYEACAQAVDLHQKILLPVPLYGRGDSLYALCKAWFPSLITQYVSSVEQVSENVDIILLQDAQLHQKLHQKFAETWITQGNVVMFTGECDRSSFSNQLRTKGTAIVRRYPVHMNYADVSALMKENHFQKVMLFHSTQFHSVVEDGITFSIEQNQVVF